jgi:hypothetical protein
MTDAYKKIFNMKEIFAKTNAIFVSCGFPLFMPNKILAQYVYIKVKVKYTLIQALRFCTGRTVHRKSGGIVLLFHDQRH